MAGTRSSARQAASNSSPPSAKSTNGTKRKADDTSSPTANTKAKRGRPSKAQKTLEETMPDADDEAMKDANNYSDATNGNVTSNGNGDGHQGNENGKFQRPDGCWGWSDKHNYGTATNAIKGVVAEGEVPDSHTTDGQDGEAKADPDESFKGQTKAGEDRSDPEKALKDSRGGAGVNALDKVHADEKDEGKTSKTNGSQSHAHSNGNENENTSDNAIESDKEREKAQPSNVLEKGVIYFFTRGRVGTDDPDSVQDLQRSFFVLRPLAPGAKITDGSVDVKNARVFALPKKVWPKSGKDKFMAFVEKAGASIEELKTDLFEGSTYSTKTTGTNHTPNIAPIGEGVYALTRTGGGQGTTHLAYMLTVPTSLGEVQTDVGLSEKGSFVVSLKNPRSKGPANAQLPQGPDYPEEFFEEFRGRGWMPPDAKHLDYANAQILLIGENFESSDNLQANPKDEKDDSKVTPEEELTKLEEEDEQRIERLKGDDTIFADLHLSKKDYGLMTTW